VPWPASIAADGGTAVAVFFILSGYVLTPPFTGHQPPSYLAFIVRRFCRIWLPFLAIVGAACAVYSRIDLSPLPIVSDISAWNPELTSWALAHTFLMTGQYLAFDPPMWSLVPEIRISAVFPIVALCAISWRPSTAILFAIAFSALVSRLVYAASPLLVTLGETAAWVWLFVLGSVLYVARARLATWYECRSRCAKLVMLALALLLLDHAILPWHRWGHVGAALLFVIAIHSGRAARLLEHPALIWLGQLSYSLYLVHYPVIIVLTRALWPTLPYWVIIAIVPPSSLLLAAIAHQIIERPATGIGARLSRLVERAGRRDQHANACGDNFSRN
jgi:peptidoglycan/LPS O-acetylase OafA/YrhL